MKRSYHHGDLHRALLEAAEALLEREGIGALTLRATAREAGVSHAAPSHHFVDLSGLLSALAATGFVRLHDRVRAEIAGAEHHAGGRAAALGRGYVGFAEACPALFQLMFRSERLDWSNPVLSGAGAAAFALLTSPEDAPGAPSVPPGLQDLVAATARWASMHGLSMLLIDGRLGAMSAKVPGTPVHSLVAQVLTRLARQET